MWKNAGVPLVVYHKQQAELHYRDNSLEEADTPASVEVANVMHKTSMFLHLFCHHVDLDISSREMW